MMDLDVLTSAHEAELNRLVTSGEGLHPAMRAAYDRALAGGPLPSGSQILEWFEDPNHVFYVNGQVLFYGDGLAYVCSRDWYGWGLPTSEHFEKLVPLVERAGGMVEVGAGSGFWSALLRAHTNVPVIATDNGSWSANKWYRSYSEIAPLKAADAVRAYDDRLVLTVFPTELMGSEIIEHMRPGQTLVHVGEHDHTGDITYHKRLMVDMDPMGVVRGERLKDPMYIFERREQRREHGPFNGLGSIHDRMASSMQMRMSEQQADRAR